MMPFLDLKAQYRSIKSEVDQAVGEVLDSGVFILGKQLEEFERKFSSFVGTKHAKGVNSGTSALHAALLAKGIGPGDEVITSPLSFLASATSISYCGATPTFADIDKETYNIDPTLVEKAITPKTKAIMPVHLYGQPADMKPIMEIASKHNLLVIEDAAQAHGCEQNGKRIPIADIGCFSFYPTKNLGAYGEGGAVVSNDLEFMEQIDIIRNHGQKIKNVHQRIGYNYRLEELQAAILKVKVDHIEQWNEKRRKHAAVYDELLEDSKVALPKIKEGNTSVYHLYVVRSPKRDALQEQLKSKGVPTVVHYPTPIHLQPAYADLGHGKGSFPLSEQYASEMLSLPLYPEMTQEQITTVSNAVKSFS